MSLFLQFCSKVITLTKTKLFKLLNLNKPVTNNKIMCVHDFKLTL